MSETFFITKNKWTHFLKCYYHLRNHLVHPDHLKDKETEAQRRGRNTQTRTLTFGPPWLAPFQLFFPLKLPSSDFPDDLVVRTLPSSAGAQVRSLVGKLRSHVPHGMDRKQNNHQKPLLQIRDPPTSGQNPGLHLQCCLQDCPISLQ